MKRFSAALILILSIISCKEERNENCFIYSSDITLNTQIENLIHNDSLEYAEQLLRDRISTKQAKHVFYHNLGVVLFKRHASAKKNKKSYKKEILNQYYTANDLCPNSKTTIGNIVNTHHHYDDYSQTIKNGENYLSLFKPHLDMYKMLSYSYRELNDPDSSLQHAQKGIELDSSCHYCYYLKAEALNDLEQYNEAELFYKKALESEPNDFNYLYGMGRLKFRMKDNQSALLYYLKALELDPNDEMNLIILSRIYFSQGNSQIACEYLSRAIDLKCLTCTTRQKKDYDEKIVELKKECAE